MKVEEFTEKELSAAQKAARFIVDRGFATPALLFIELNRPLNYVGSQVLALFEPFIQAFVLTEDYPSFISFLEKRDSVDTMLALIDEMDEKKRREVKEEKRKLKKERTKKKKEKKYKRS